MSTVHGSNTYAMNWTGPATSEYTLNGISGAIAALVASTGPVEATSPPSVPQPSPKSASPLLAALQDRSTQYRDREAPTLSSQVDWYKLRWRSPRRGTDRCLNMLHPPQTSFIGVSLSLSGAFRRWSSGEHCCMASILGLITGWDPDRSDNRGGHQ
jgi:hypothetical protein